LRAIRDFTSLATRHASRYRGCDLTAEWRRAKAHVRVRFPATAPLTDNPQKETRETKLCYLRFLGVKKSTSRPRASLRDRVSKTQLARGSTEAACQLQKVFSIQYSVFRQRVCELLNTEN
jgi:hypothetical protein